VIYQSFEKGESDYSGFDAFTEEFKTVPELWKMVTEDL
jgi:hypothetical protein